MRVGPLVALLLLAPALAGCMESPLERRTPVVLVRHEVSWAGEGVGHAEGYFGFGCRMARYDVDPLDVTLYHPRDWTRRPDFLVLHDYGDAWRAHVPDGGAGVHPLLVGAAASGGGPLERIFGDAVSTAGTSSTGTPSPFPRHAPELPPVVWREGRPWLGEAPLAQGTGTEMSFAYEVPTAGGGRLAVTHVLTATYLGRVVVDLQEQRDDCRGRPVPVLASPPPA